MDVFFSCFFSFFERVKPLNCQLLEKPRPVRLSFLFFLSFSFKLQHMCVPLRHKRTQLRRALKNGSRCKSSRRSEAAAKAAGLKGRLLFVASSGKRNENNKIKKRALVNPARLICQQRCGSCKP